MNTKGIIRIIEASISILIILTVVLFILVTRKPSVEVDLSERIGPLLEEIAKNNSIREEIINNSAGANVTIRAFLDSRIERNIGYDFIICNLASSCSLAKYPEDATGNIYVGSRIISSILTRADPKRVSIFLWIRR